MTWYYVQEGQRKGPLEASEFEELVRQGTIQPGTMVWREGMADWQPYAGNAATEPAPVSTETRMAGVACSRCGNSFPPSQLVHIGGVPVCAVCKPVALQSLQEGVVSAHAESDSIRREHIGHEASIKSVGILYFVGGGMLVLAGVTSTVAAMRESLVSMVPALFLLLLGAVQIWTGAGLRSLLPWSRIVSGVISGIGLLGFPLGTLVNGYILYLLFCRKGATVFSPAYRQVILATPHIKYRTSMVVWVLLGIVILLFVAGIAAVLIRK